MTDHGDLAQLAALADIDVSFQLEQIGYWLFGGWAVDFHVGEVTREHGDLDIAVWWDDRDRVATLLANRHWVHRPDDDEDGYTRYERGGVRLEVAFITRDEDGIVYTPLAQGRGDWPLGAFGNDVHHLHGVQARVVSREALIVDKSVVRADPGANANDQADVASLDRRASDRESRD